MTVIFAFCLMKRLRNLSANNLLCDVETITKINTQQKILSYGNLACYNLYRLNKDS